MEAFSRSVPNTVEKIMRLPSAKPLCVLLRNMPVATAQEYLERELVKCAAQINVAGNLQPHQVPFIAETILERYSGESLEDITLCLRRGSMGYYGTIYNRFDMAVISEWMGKHIEEKCYYLEREAVKGKQDEGKLEVDYKAFKTRLEQERLQEQQRKRDKIVKADEFEEFKTGYVPLTPEQLQKREWHGKYLLAKWQHDQDPHNKGQIFPEEALWIELQKINP